MQGAALSDLQADIFTWGVAPPEPLIPQHYYKTVITFLKVNSSLSRIFFIFIF